MKSSTALFTTFILFFFFGIAARGEVKVGKVEQRKGVTVHLDIEYARVDDHTLKLDLYMPTHTTESPRLVVFFHGGSWRAGSKKSCHVSWLANHGYAVASVDYRLSKVAKFPALVHDCKGAIRFLRAHADRFGYDAESIAVSGASAGGHLAALVATSGSVKELEGDVGGNLDQSSRVQAALAMFCPTDLYYNATVEKERCDQPNCPLYQLLGGKPSEHLEQAKLASATTHVTKDDPPIILLYGSEDKSLVKPLHGERLKARYDEMGVSATYQLIKGAGHGGPKYRDAERSKMILAMLDQQLKKWNSLFDGKSLSDWRVPDNDSIQVVDGEIRITPNPQVFYLHKAKFADFVLQLEVKMPDKDFDSGIGFRCVLPKGKSLPAGLQCEVSDIRSGGIYDIGVGWVTPKESDEQIKAFVDRTGEYFKAGEWNTVRVQCEGERIRTWINGHLCSDIKNSKHTRGSIGLQHNSKTGTYRFRNIQIREIETK